MRTIRVILIILVCQSVLTAKLEETVAIHSKGSNIRLTCYRENPQDKLLWTTSKGTILFNDDVRYSKAEQYSNFEVEILEDRSTLIIENAELDDEGEYVCSDSMGREMVNVSIEVAPNLDMKVNGIIETSFMPNISITCRAAGAKPEVSIRIRVGEDDWLMPTVSATTPSGLLWDTIAKFNILLPTDVSGTSVTCQTLGQISVEHITVTEYLSSPVCILQYSTFEISCNCTSNPPVDKYLFAIEGENNVTGSTAGTLSVASIMGSEVTCYGLSILGIGKSNVIVVPPKEESGNSSVFFIITIVASIVIVALVASFVTWVAYTRRKRRREDNIDLQKVDETGKVGETLLPPTQTGEDENKQRNDAKTDSPEDDVKTTLLAPQTDKENSEAPNGTQKNTSDTKNNESVNGNQKNPSGSRENNLRNNATTGSAGDDGGTPPIVTKAGDEGGTPPTVTKAGTSGDDGGTPPIVTKEGTSGDNGGKPPVVTKAGDDGGTPPIVTKEGTSGDNGGKPPVVTKAGGDGGTPPIVTKEGTSENDAEWFTQGFSMSGGVQQRATVFGGAHLKPKPT